MKERHGIDELGIGLIWLGVIFTVISYFLKNSFFSALALAIVIFEVFRTLSKNEIQRNSENYVFKAKFLNPITSTFRSFKRKTVGDKNYKYIKCKNCGQELRIPKGKGKIKVKCPKCKESQEVRS